VRPIWSRIRRDRSVTFPTAFLYVRPASPEPSSVEALERTLNPAAALGPYNFAGRGGGPKTWAPEHGVLGVKPNG